MNHKKSERKFVLKEIISNHLTCSICQEIFYDPVRINCGHTFCHECLSHWYEAKNQCPICRVSFKKKNIGRDLIAFNIINDLSVLCIHQNCPWKGNLSELGKHLKTCYFNPVMMPDYLKTSLENSSDKTPKPENMKESINDSDLNFNVNSSLAARLYSKNPELVKKVMSFKAGVKGKEQSFLELIDQTYEQDKMVSPSSPSEPESNQKFVGRKCLRGK